MLKIGMSPIISYIPLLEKCPNTEFFPVRIFPHSDRIRRDNCPYSARMWENTDQKELRIWTLFTQWYFTINVVA